MARPLQARWAATGGPGAALEGARLLFAWLCHGHAPPGRSRSAEGRRGHLGGSCPGPGGLWAAAAIPAASPSVPALPRSLPSLPQPWAGPLLILASPSVSPASPGCQARQALCSAMVVRWR